jgi:hypothetical protein
VPRPPSLAEGTDGRDGVELELTWELGDDGGPAAAFELSVGLGDDPVRPVTTMDGSARNAVVVVEPGLTATYAIVALDAGEAPGATARWDPLTADRLQESSPTVTYGGRWRHAAGPSLSDGGVVYSRGRGAEATLQFVGTDVGWVATRTPQSGRAEVSIDGQPVGTVDLSAGSVRYRQVVFRHHLLIGGAHEMRIRAIGDRRVDVDAFLVLR